MSDVLVPVDGGGVKLASGLSAYKRFKDMGDGTYAEVIAGGSGGSGGSTPTGTAGAPNPAVMSVQGVSGGSAVPVSLSNALSLAAGSNAIGLVTLTPDQDPVFDAVNGKKITATTTSAQLIATVVSCHYVRVTTDADIVIHLSGGAAIDDGTCLHLQGGSTEVIPVQGGAILNVAALSGAATVRAMPQKPRP